MSGGPVGSGGVSGSVLSFFDAASTTGLKKVSRVRFAMALIVEMGELDACRGPDM